MKLKVTISGSFHKHLDRIMESVQTFKELNVDVLSPKDPRVVDSIGKFLFVASDNHRSIRLVQDRHLSSIVQSDFLWLVASDGYIGQSASLELGFAIAYNVPIFCETIPPDLTLQQYIIQVRNEKEAIKIIKKQEQKIISQKSSLLINPNDSVEIAHNKLDSIKQLLSNPGGITSRMIEISVDKECKDIKEILQLPYHNK